MRRVLVLEANETVRQSLLLGLHDHGFEAEGLPGVGDGLAALASGRVAVVVLSLADRDEEGELTELISTWSRAALAASGDPYPDVVAVVRADSDQGFRALRRGAADFVSQADGVAGLALALRKLEARRAFRTNAGRASAVRSPDRSGGSPEATPAGASTLVARGGLVPPAPAGPALVGNSPRITAVLALIQRLAGVRASVLIEGESGTGKELVAQALHDQSPWRTGPFVAVNCGAIPASLIESELFGHVRGSFTDAVRDRQGFFEAANGGTLFLDEIGDLPLALQPKLLRVLQDGMIRRLGDTDDVRVEVRVVAATARDLASEVEARRFREDLYYRLAGFVIQLPPLRERRQDISLLARHFLAIARRRVGVSVNGIDADALRLLEAYPWPGNVRELENTIERAAVLCAGDRIDVASLPERMVPPGGGDRLGGDHAAQWGLEPAFPEMLDENASLSIKRAARRSEEVLIRRALIVTGGNRTRAAEHLEISHRALLYKIKEYGITIASGREPPVTAEPRMATDPLKGPWARRNPETT